MQGRRPVQERVVLRRRLRQAGQQRRLGEVQAGHRGVEEHVRRRGHPVRGLAPDGAVGDVVEVAAQDPVLAVAGLELLSQLGLHDLVLEVVLGLDASRHVDVVDQLHGQRGRALQAATVDRILDRRAQDALVVERAVLVEAPVLDRDRGLLEDVGDPAPGDRVADVRGVDVAQRAFRPRRRSETVSPEAAGCSSLRLGADCATLTTQPTTASAPTATAQKVSTPVRATRRPSVDPRLRRRRRCRSRRLMESVAWVTVVAWGTTATVVGRTRQCSFRAVSSRHLRLLPAARIRARSWPALPPVARC